VSGSTWATPTTTTGTTSSSYAAQTFTSSGSSQTIYGWYIVGATSGTLIAAEKFATARTLVSPDTITVTPRIELA
jgi:hypothetical protein